MIDLEAFDYSQEKPTEPGWYSVYNLFDLTARKLIADWDGRLLHFGPTADSGDYYSFGDKIAERTTTAADRMNKEVGLEK